LMTVGKKKVVLVVAAVNDARFVPNILFMSLKLSLEPSAVDRFTP
jgi:hypothetical protein